MGKTWGQFVGVMILVVALALGAGPSAGAAEKVTVGIGGVALMVYMPTVLAKAKGYFAEEGLDVEILDIKGGGSQAASALIGGSVDFSANAIDHAIKAKAQGKDLLAVHSHVRLAPMGLVVANKYKGEIKSIADLKGRPLGVTSPGSQTHMVLGYLLAKNGVKADEVKIIGAGGNTMPLAIEKDTVHAGVLVDPFFTVFLKQGKGYALVDMFTTKGTLDAMGGEVQGTTLLTRPDVIAKRPATVQKMVNALVKANKLITSSSGEELAKLLPRELAGDPKLYAESFEHAREAFPPDSLVSREGVARVLARDDDRHARPDHLLIEHDEVRGGRAGPFGEQLIDAAVEDRTGGTHRRAHGGKTDRGSVVAHVAFVLEHLLDIELRNAERAGVHTVGTADASLFRGLVHARSGADVFVTSVKGDSVLIYPMQVWADMEERVLKAPTQHPALVKFMDRVSYFGQPGELDPQGRVAIPPHLRQRAGITGEVRVLGRINFLEVWNEDRFVDKLAREPWTDDDGLLLSQHGI